MVVVVLAGVVTLGLVGFYLSSQATWLDASTQALVQRDATTLVEAITRESREAGGALVLGAPPDSTNSELLLYDNTFAIELRRFSWDSTDSLVHVIIGGQDQGPVVSSICERFQVALDDSFPVVHLNLIQLRGSNGDRVKISSSVRLYNANP
jgi:hypothetical protein